MAYKYKTPSVIDPPGTLRAQIVDEIERWNSAAGATVVSDYDLPMKTAATDPAEPATVVLNLRGSKVVFTVRRWGDFRTNLWAVKEAIRQFRLNEERGLADTLAQAYKALPAPEGVFETRRDPYEVLGLTRDADKRRVDAMHRALAGDAMREAKQADLLELNNAKAAIYAAKGWGGNGEATS